MALEVNYNRPMDGSTIERNGSKAFTVKSESGEVLFKYEADHEMNVLEVRKKAGEMYEEMKQNSNGQNNSVSQQAEPEGFFDKILSTLGEIKSFFFD